MFSQSFIRWVPGAVLLLLLVVVPVRAAEFTAGTASELATAVTQANANGETDTIRLVGNPTLTLAAPLEITSDVTIVGPGTFNGDGMYNLVSVLGCTTTLDNLTFQECATWRGAVIAGEATLSVTRCTFENCVASIEDYFCGGAITSDDARITLTDSTFTGNSTVKDAGAISMRYGSLTVSGCTFNENASPFENTWGGYAGAITTMECPITATDSTFTTNTSKSMGGAISCIYGYVNLNGCTFTENSAFYMGGAVSAYGPGMEATDCTFTGNTTSVAAGAISYTPDEDEFDDFETDYTMWLSGCVFHDNSIEGIVLPDSGMAIAGGGAIVTGGDTVAINCQFTNNRVRLIHAADDMLVETYGGAVLSTTGLFGAANCIFSANSVTSANTSSFGGARAFGGAVGTFNNGYYEMLAVNCTFSGNTANASATDPDMVSAVGGGVAIAAETQVINSVLWGNLANGAPSQAKHIQDNIFYTNFYSCDIQGGEWAWTGTGNIDADPAFARNPSAGDDGIWGTADDDAGDLALTADSPCIDMGTNDAFDPEVLPTDLAGNPRIVNDIVDMGAYEFQGAPADTTPPIITTPGNLTATATSPAGAVVNFTVSAEDEVDGVITPVVAPASGSVFPLGTTTVNCSATDAAGNNATASFTITVTYDWSGFLQPIDPPNAQGISSSIFKAGSTVPIKFKLTGASAGITTATAQLTYAKISNAVIGSDVEAISTAASTTGNLFRYDPQTGQYIFNWSTKGLTSGTYRISVTLGDGVSRTVIISLK